GTSTYYYAGGRDRDLAQSIQTSLTQMNSVYDRGIRQGDFKVLRENKDLAVLIELGFITNPGELENVQSPAFQDEAAKAITNGLINYFNN
ncbi:MAG TPA: N-acetylmuramoyl-L-alanine amidase, partial [Candidatus Avamphibacillus sp.]|nr:N-acetylmuramoyl-L-alanine amidase [Candidatus Avamphibacillus sp.]